MNITKYVLTYSGGVIEFASITDRSEFIENNDITEFTTSEVVEELLLDNDPHYSVERAIKEAQAFGANLAMEFLIENTLLGITELGMIEKVRELLDMTFRAVETGSLREAINRIKAIPEEKRYPIFVTEERMLKYVNKMEEFLGVELSTNLY